MQTTTSRVTFQAPFFLNAIVGELPAGRYDFEVDEEPIGGAGTATYRRLATLLIVQGGGTTRTLQIGPKQLKAALHADAALNGSV